MVLWQPPGARNGPERGLMGLQVLTLPLRSPNIESAPHAPAKGPTMPVHSFLQPPARRNRFARCPGLVGVIAIMAMVLAGPAHLWLAHGGGQDEASCQGHVAHAGCHGHSCTGHLHTVLAENEEVPEVPEDRKAPSPCSGHGGDCDTCLALGAAKPIDLVENTDLGDVRLLEIGDFIDESSRSAELVGSAFPRGPPTRA